MSLPPDTLWEAIRKAKVKSEYPAKADFWPEGSLRKIIMENDISTELYPRATERGPPFVDNELIQFVQKNGKKLLAICLMCRIRRSDLELAMYEFRKCGLNDQSLPVSQEVLLPYAERLQWYEPDVHNFLQHQWKFVVPKFSMSRCLMPGLADGTILPFVELLTVAKGNFGTVYKVRVHPSHFDPNDPIHQVRYHFQAIRSIDSLCICDFAPSPCFLVLLTRPELHRQLIPGLTLLRQIATSLSKRSSSRAKNTRTYTKMPSLVVNRGLCWP